MTTPSAPPLCVSCRHRHVTTVLGVHTCDAFPDGIPDAIWVALGDHRDPVPGDHGVQYERSPSMEAGTAFRMWSQRVAPPTGT
jgi:hypothetical protein